MFSFSCSTHFISVQLIPSAFALLFIILTFIEKISPFTLHLEKYIVKHDDFTGSINPPFQDTLESAVGKGWAKSNGVHSVTQRYVLSERATLRFA